MRRYGTARGWSVFEAVYAMDDHRHFEQVQSMLQRGVDSHLASCGVRLDRLSAASALDIDLNLG